MSVSSIIYCIPSYARAATIGKKTLKLLTQHDVPVSDTYIFVANEDELRSYAVANPAYANCLVVGKLGIRDQRNFICKYFPEGAKLVFLDDDVSDVKRLVPGVDSKANKLVSVRDFRSFCREAFVNAQEKNASIWGLYPVANAMFMRDTVTLDLRFIGCVYGQVNRRSSSAQLTVKEKEDFENVIKRFIHDGAVMRFSNVCYVTSGMGTGKGGLQTVPVEIRQISHETAATTLLKRYPDLVKRSVARARGFAEIRLFSA